MKLWLLIIIFVLYFGLLACLLMAGQREGVEVTAIAADRPYYLITWSPPADTGGDPTITYNITITQEGQTDPVVSQQGLTNTEYQFTAFGTDVESYTISLTAVNSGGTSPPATLTFSTFAQPQVSNIQILDTNTGNPPMAGDSTGDITVTFTLANDEQAAFDASNSSLGYQHGTEACTYAGVAGSLTQVGNSGWSVKFTKGATCPATYQANGVFTTTIKIANPQTVGTGGPTTYTVVGSPPLAPQTLNVTFMTT